MIKHSSFLDGGGSCNIIDLGFGSVSGRPVMSQEYKKRAECGVESKIAPNIRREVSDVGGTVG